MKNQDGRFTLSAQDKSGVLFLVLAEDCIFNCISVQYYFLWIRLAPKVAVANDRHINVTFEA